MALTTHEEQTIRNLIDRLSLPNCGCHNPLGTEKLVEAVNNFADGSARLEVVSRLYLDTWVIPALRLLLPGEIRNPELASKLSAR